MLNSYSLDHCGPLTRSVRDCALVMNAVVAHDPDDPASISRPDDVDYTAGLDDGIGGWTIGHIAHLYERDLPANDEVRMGMRTAIATLKALGYGRGYLSGSVLRQALLLGAAGYAAAFGLTLVLYEVSRSATRLPLRRTLVAPGFLEP